MIEIQILHAAIDEEVTYKPVNYSFHMAGLQLVYSTYIDFIPWGRIKKVRVYASHGTS